MVPVAIGIFDIDDCLDDKYPDTVKLEEAIVMLKSLNDKSLASCGHEFILTIV